MTAKVRDMTLALLDARAPEATICPSEVARLIAAADEGRTPGNWRSAMPIVHAAVDTLVAQGMVRVAAAGRMSMHGERAQRAAA